MMALQVKNLRIDFEGRPILDGVTFHLAGGERVGLVGANGCGKSTLMKILAGELEAGGGSVTWVTPGLSHGYLSQQDLFDPAAKLGAQLGPVPADLLARCGIGPELLERTPAELSGGQKTRAALAAVLATRPDVLLLDEPTNHLDTDGLQWLEALLKSYRGAVLVVSHDRYFLDQVATRILELENGKLKEYPGNYSAYARQKQMELERARDEYRQYLKLKQHLEAAIRRQIGWAESNETRKLPAELKVKKAEYKGQAKKHMQTAQAIEARLERNKKEKPRDAARINIRMDGAGSVARNLILADGLGFSYDGVEWVFRGASFYVQRGDKLAITGPNGAGKSTLVKLILGDLAPGEGSLYRSPLRVAYLAQELEHLDPAHTVLQAATGDTAMDQAYARSLLGCLLFSRDDVLKPVAVLSGGEKVRLALAKLLLAAPDLLVLDEPTNGLDLPSRERVEEALLNYPGTLLLVSHDRYLLQRVPTKELRVAAGRVDMVTAAAAPVDDRAERRLLLETRLAQLSAALAAPGPDEKERLDREFIEISRELRSLR